MSSAAATITPVATGSVRKTLLLQTTVALILSLAIGLYFWVDSRYPSLLKKLHSGQSIKVSGALSFDALMPVKPEMSLPVRVERTAINWMWTNRIGMTFGLGFGAALLTLLSTLPGVRFQSAASNTLLGAVAGVPLGVCANCVAPIGRGLFVGGASPNTVLATMISSPTLNVVVLMMTFALFPLPVALVRLAVPLLLLVSVPLLVRRTPPAQREACPVPAPDGWLRPTGSTLKTYLKNLGNLAVATIPFMILAAVLGALLAEIIPAQSIPANVTVLGIVLVALAGTFLPVPMAFDVAIAFILMVRGVPLPYVVTLLCTLGAFSIYSLFILGRTMSWRTAASFFGAVMLLGVTAGIGAGLLQHSF